MTDGVMTDSAIVAACSTDDLNTIVAALAGINAKIASGVQSASYEGKSTTFRSLDDMLWVRSDLLNALAGCGAGGMVRTRQYKTMSRKAL
jgi:hypothetical protein